MSRYLWISAFAICGLAAWAWIETIAHAHREAMERLLAESEKSRATIEAEEAAELAWNNS